MTKIPASLLKQASVLEITENDVRMRQFKDRWGVCVVSHEQHDAAEKIIAVMGRKLVAVIGSKRDDLRYTFDPALTEEEYETFFG